ncbi:MAG: putative baseplate assembly protein [Roseiflexaceae bacterium]
MNISANCNDDERRDAVRHKPSMNGLDYLDVGSDQLTLTVFFLGKAPEQLLRAEGENPAAYKQRLRRAVQIEGGRRVRDIAIQDVELRQARDSRTGKIDPLTDDRMIVRVNKYGDFSTYTLRLIGLKQIDPFYDHLDFTFKIDCPSDFDCAPDDTCPPPTLVEPEINYLAKDYASFRQLILDRLALIMPDWKERHVPDIGITLVELLAYVGDYLSYYQDAVATEAYLDTARQRISVRRHARLVDYQMHEGCNARAWVCINTDTDLASDEEAIQPGDCYFITSLNNALAQAGSAQTAAALGNITSDQYEVFEPVATDPIKLYVVRNQICFYTWGQRECCLPRGATSATLHVTCAPAPLPPTPTAAARRSSEKGLYATPAEPTEPPPAPPTENLLHLRPGDVLIFEELIGPRTGNSADADPARRHAVRLTRVTTAADVLYDPPVQLVEIEWAIEDALPFTLCISAITDAAHGCTYVENISVARGNVILVDHGRTLDPPQDLGIVPCMSTQAECDCADHPGDTSFTAGRYRPKLERAPLTWRQALPADDPQHDQFVAASRLLLQDVRAAAPQVHMSSIPAAVAASCELLGPLYSLADVRDPARLAASLDDMSNPITRQLHMHFSKPMRKLLDQPHDDDTLASAGQKELSDVLKQQLNDLLQAWSAQPDLLSSRSDAWHFVVEIDNDGIGNVRFGDGTLGRQPEAGAAFFATYRIGSGVRGNVGAEAISQIVFRNTPDGAYLQARNPQPAQGGTEPEPIAEVKLYAPFAFRKQLERAITANDYAQLAQRNFEHKIQHAAATMSWTGSWYEARVAIDPFGNEEAGQDLLDSVGRQLGSFRRIGHDVNVTSAQYVPLDIALSVCVLPHYLRGHVEAALLQVFSDRVLPNGKRGFFHPDNLMFGDGIYLSQLVAAAQAVTGVESVTITKLQRLGDRDRGELDRGVLPLGPLEVARLNNDPNFPEHGKLMLNVRGGR